MNLPCSGDNASVLFHNEVNGGEKFFLLLGRMAQAPAEHIQLVLMAVLAVGLALWFGGPWIGIGESRPLADVSVRVLVLVLSLSLLLFWLPHWPISVIGAIIMGLLIWYGSPLLVIGDA